MLNFNNLQIAFKDKSNKDLNRAYLLFKTLKNPVISNILTLGVKITMWLRIPVGIIIKSTVYQHFCGGTTIEDSQETINKLWESNIGTILDFSAEGKESEEDFNKVMHETLASINKAEKEENIPFAVFKLTGLARFNLLQKINFKETLNKNEIIEKKVFIKRVEKICQSASRRKVCIFIDAEESWIQDVIDQIALDMMMKFNKEDVLIYHTIQLYRKDRIKYLKELLEQSKEYQFKLGIKIVRGAYYEKENKKAKEEGYTSPVHESKEDTDNDYNLALKICVENINNISICAGTHNEESLRILSTLLKEHNILNSDKRVYFSQLLGMSDHISYNAAVEGYNVGKYVPYGPIKDVMPYLIRRAKENTSITGQMGRELRNIILEKRRRKKSNNHRPPPHY